MHEKARSGGGDWDERLLFAPLNAIPERMRWVVVLAAVALTVGWSAWLGGNLMLAWGLPDVGYYVAMAHRRVDLVPQPFSARPLAPLLARWIAASLHCWMEGGFTVLAYVSLAWTAGVVYWLLLRTGAPRWMLLALVAVPFWPQLLVHAGLPDPLYAGLLAGLLVALEREWVMAAAGLMFPLMLARESTALTLVCLLMVGWRRLRWTGCGLAVCCAVLGSLVVRRMSVGGLPNPEHMSAGLYLVSKMAANLLRSVGIVPWSNVYPELCGAPRWQMALHVGPVRSVGVCAWSAISPVEVAGALLTTFGVLPWVVIVGWRSWREVWRRGDATLRFCLVYGGISLAIAPALGTWFARLFGYGWPLLLVGVPHFVEAWGEVDGKGERERFWRATGAVLLAVHLVVCALGNELLSLGELVWLAGGEVIAFALILVLRRAYERAAEPHKIQPSAW